MSGWGMNDLEPQEKINKTKTMSDYAKEFKEWGKFEPLNSSHFAEAVKKISEFVNLKQTEMILAWWAEYGFKPGDAVLVHGVDHNGQYLLGIRSQTPEEAEMIKNVAMPSKGIEQIISDIYKEWKPKTKAEQWVGVHSSDKGEEHEDIMYWDVTKCQWTLKEFAFEGYLREIMKPIIEKIIDEKSI